jgi:ABC-type spermidine/putrescine transport system permease subunit I
VSLSNWSITGAHNFVGFANYANILGSETFRTSFLNTVGFAVVTVLFQYLLGLALAVLVYRTTRGQGVLRLLLLVPMMFTPVVVGFVWKTMFDPGYGPISWLFDRLGLPEVPWFSEKLPAMAAIVTADVWQWTPFMFLILFAALRSLPTAPLEAAMVDGASGWRLFIDHMMPMLLPASMTAILLRTIEAFKLFDVVYLMTGDSIFAEVAFWNITAGVVGGLLAAVFGLIDWVAIPSGTRAKVLGMWHGLGNLVIVLLFIVSWLIRLGDHAYAPNLLPFLLGLVAVGMALVTAWLGGELVYRLRVAVDDGANLDAPSSLTRESRPRSTDEGGAGAAG